MAASVDRAAGPAHRARAVLLGLALVCLGLLVAVPLTGSELGLWLTCAHWVVSGGVAVLGTLLARTAAGSAPDREGWGLLLTGQLCWLAAVVIYDGFVLTGRYPPSPTVSDVLWLGAGVVSAAGLRRLGRARTRRRDLSWMELAPLGAAVCVLLLVLLWPQIERSTLGPVAVVTILAYPFVYVSIAMVMIQAVVAGSLQLRHNWGLGAVLAGLVVEAGTFVAWAPPLLGQTYLVGDSLLDPAWSIGMMLIGVGAWAARPVEGRADLTGARNRGGVLPTVSFLLLSAVQIVATGRDARMGALSIGVGMVGVLLAIRGSALRRTNAALRLDSRTDPLMGIANRLQLVDDLRDADERAAEGERYAVALFDLDHFKAYNDGLGHQAGDLALQSVAMLLDRTSRGGDRIYRYGGEELLLLIRGVDLDQARQVAERQRGALEQARLSHPGNEPYGVMTTSVGVACVLPGETPQQVTERADAALYRAKEQGRNRVVAAGVPVPPAKDAVVPRPRSGDHDAAQPSPGGPGQPHA
ncbi:GGDEF domain-containing protein [Kineosporia sp. J2-2]|uniref:GGDEF domain-containing protein n=1 Tax=Kineosporia corallincola TaxID=2835133 RepID=A0ABS5TTF4_9ACTN|nr:GGDEF domain-containing protein [Kineosporia corallincola]MBT0774070.1 GGDEF domain-containing protein [Kineosporia corallincola]